MGAASSAFYEGTVLRSATAQRQSTAQITPLETSPSPASRSRSLLPQVQVGTPTSRRDRLRASSVRDASGPTSPPLALTCPPPATLVISMTRAEADETAQAALRVAHDILVTATATAAPPATHLVDASATLPRIGNGKVAVSVSSADPSLRRGSLLRTSATSSPAPNAPAPTHHRRNSLPSIVHPCAIVTTPRGNGSSLAPIPTAPRPTAGTITGLARSKRPSLSTASSFVSASSPSVFMPIVAQSDSACEPEVAAIYAAAAARAAEVSSDVIPGSSSTAVSCVSSPYSGASGVSSPTLVDLHHMFSEENPDFLVYKARWEAMREQHTALRKAGGLKDGRSLLSPSRCSTRNHSCATSRATSRATSPHTVSPFGSCELRSTSSPRYFGNERTDCVSPFCASPQVYSPLAHSQTDLCGHLSSALLQPQPQPDGVTTFEPPAPLPLDDLGEEVSTPCSSVPGPFVHAGSIFAMLIESNRSSPLVPSPMPGYLLRANDAAAAVIQQRARKPQRARSHSDIVGNFNSSPPSDASVPTTRAFSRRSSLPVGLGTLATAVILEETTPQISRLPSAIDAQPQRESSAGTDWKQVQKELDSFIAADTKKGLCDSLECVPSPPHLVSSPIKFSPRPTQRQINAESRIVLAVPSAVPSQQQQKSASPSPLSSGRARITILPSSLGGATSVMTSSSTSTTPTPPSVALSFTRRASLSRPSRRSLLSSPMTRPTKGLASSSSSSFLPPVATR